MNITELKNIIDKSLSGNSKGLPEYEDLVEGYVNNKLNFKEYKDNIENDDSLSDDDKDFMLDEIENQRQEMIKYYIEGDGKKGFENKYNELKAEINNSKTAASKLPSAITSAISLVLIPPTLTGIPNPIKEAVNLNTSKNQILSSIESFFGSLSKVFGISEELGLEDNVVITNLAKLSEPLLLAKSEMESQPTQEAETIEEEQTLDSLNSTISPSIDIS
jgi:uncharacterized protein YukE